MTYQPRFIAYMKHTGLSADEVKNHEYSSWIQAKWSEYEQLRGINRPYTPTQHKEFTEWLLDTADGQLTLF